MSETNNGPDNPKAPEPRQPRCPYCKAKPCQIYIHMVSFSGAPAAVFCCGKCDKVLGVAPVPVEPQRQPRERASGLILPTM